MKYSKITTNWKQLCLLSASTLLLTASSFAQFLGLESEVYATTEYGTTYRISATFGNPMDECVAVYSIGTAEIGAVDLELGVTTSFWQHAAGANLATGISPFFVGLVPELAYDSWLTVGAEDSDGGAVASLGMGEAFEAFDSGAGFILNGEVGGSWYVIPGSNLDALAGEDGKVLLAQLTVTDEEGGDIGNVWCDWNIMWRNEAGLSTAVTGVLLDTSNSSSDISGCMDPVACNYNASATDDDGSCAELDECDECGGDGIAAGSCDCAGTLPAEGYDCDGDCLGDADNDGICDGLEVAGCTDPAACNYNESATDEDGSCAVIDECDECGGDGIAAGSCDCAGTLPAEGYDCDGDCLVDADNDGICDELEIAGCMDQTACNYNENATEDDGSCSVNDECDVCGGDGIADGACDCSGSGPDEGYNCEGICLSDTDGDGVCDAFEIAGCMDNGACNYNGAATDDNGSCVFPEEGSDCSGFCLSDYDQDGVCNTNEVAGCTSTSAENYNETATDDDGTCIWADGLFTGLSYELVGHDLVEGTSTYRLYANFSGDDIQVTACYGTADDNWSISSTEPFHQDPNGDLLAQSINPAFFAFFPELEFDSWLALGGGPGSPIDLQSIGLAAFFTDFEETGADVLVNTAVGASLYYIPGEGASSLSFPVNGQMLLGQFTTAGVVSVKFNLQYRDILQQTSYGTDLNLVFPSFGVGCTDSSACNFDVDATDDDGSCYFDSAFRDCDGDCLEDSDGDNVCDAEEIAGCTSVDAWNYNADATDEDGTCVDAGCYDELACNYEPTADLGVVELCEYADPFSDCEGNCNGDYEGDGVDECQEVSGCASASANNYNPLATNDDGSCTWGDEIFLGITYEVIGDSTIGTDTTYRLYANFAPDAGVDMTSLFGNSEHPWLTMSTGDFYQHPLGADFGGNINPGFFGFFPELEFDSWLTIGAAPGDYNALAQENMYLHLPTFNAGDDLIIDTPAGAQIFLNEGSSDTQGVPDADGKLLLGQFTTSGVVFLRYNIRFEDVNDLEHEFTDIELTFPPIAGGCTDPGASNYDESSNFEDMTCIYDGCTDPVADNYNPASNLNDDSCLYTGCMDAEADNFFDLANTGDQVALCEYFGCMDLTSDNYDAGANVQDDSCLYTGCMDADADNYDGQANTGDQNALCEYFGCMDATADNYDAGANVEDDSCLYTGCMDADADNYDGQANTGDQDVLCLYTGCMDAEADNYDGQANIGDQDALCLYFGCMDEGASNYDAQANTGDQVALCEYDGCTNPIADNYNADANVDDGTCVVGACWYEEAFNYNPDATYDDSSCVFPVQGCTDPAAFNFNPSAFDDNGSCLFGGCTNIDADNYNADAAVDDGSCSYSGCMDETAANYDDGATVDDGSCLIVGCMDTDGLNYDELANFPGGCDYPDACPGDINYDGFVDVSDLLTFFQYYGTECGLE